MSALGELLREPREISAVPAKRRFFKRSEKTTERTPKPEPSLPGSPRNEQIRCLVQQLFFRHEAGPVRNVGFSPIEVAAKTGSLCLDAARALVDEGKYEVGLIDAGLGALPLHEELRIPAPAGASATWAISPRLWLVPRESWCPKDYQALTNVHLERLRELAAEFDFCIVQCPPISWLAARIGQNCDGMVLVLTANRTRRLVAAQIKDQLSKAQVPLLGTVLAERRFPVPNSLYRSL
jgi:hypothetical protein